MAITEARSIEDSLNAVRVAKLKELDEVDWLRERKKGVGGSDAASVAGVGEFKSAFEVYLDKTEQHPDGLTSRENQAMRWGKLLEDAVAEESARVHGIDLIKPEYLYQHPDPDLFFMLANPDRIIRDPNRDDLGIYEGKTCGPFVADRWGQGEDEPATYALMQFVHYAVVFGLSWGVISVLIAGQDFRTYRIELDPELAGMLVEYEANFWDQVMDRRPPDPTGLDTDTALLNRLWDPTLLVKKTITVGDEAVELVHRYNVAHEAYKKAKDEKNAAGNQLRLLMGDATEAVTEADAPVCSWRPQGQTKDDTEKWDRMIPPWFTAMFKTRDTIRVLRPNKKI